MVDFIKEMIWSLFSVFLNIASIPALVLIVVVITYPFSLLYWLRVIGCGLVLVVLGAGAMVPVYLLWHDFSAGRIFQGIFTFLLGQVALASFFYMASYAAWKWVREEIKYGRWTKMSWNAK